MAHEATGILDVDLELWYPLDKVGATVRELIVDLPRSLVPTPPYPYLLSVNEESTLHELRTHCRHPLPASPLVCSLPNGSQVTQAIDRFSWSPKYDSKACCVASKARAGRTRSRSFSLAKTRSAAGIMRGTTGGEV